MNPRLSPDMAASEPQELRMNTNTAVAMPVDQLPLAPMASESAAILSVIERMAMNPDIDPERIERFIALKERMDKEAARKAYAEALAEMQADIPVIEERGQIDYGRSGDKNAKAGPKYALWEDINEAIRPVLKAHGFALTFRTGQTPEGKIIVTGILSHRAGHQEETVMVLMHDSSGGKNAVQAIGSSISYGKRYTAGALLNFTSRGEDDDGAAADNSEVINAEQRDAILALIDKVGGSADVFCKYFKIDAVAGLPASQFDRAMKALEAKRAK